MSIKKCDCNLEAFTYLNISTGTRHYQCPLNRYTRINGVLTPTNDDPCDYHELVEGNFIPLIDRIEPTITSIKVKKETTKEKIRRLIKFFLEKKLYVTFQEIDLLCKEINIEKFNYKKESVYEYTQRVLNSI